MAHTAGLKDLQKIKVSCPCQESKRNFAVPEPNPYTDYTLNRIENLSLSLTSLVPVSRVFYKFTYIIQMNL